MRASEDERSSSGGEHSVQHPICPRIIYAGCRFSYLVLTSSKTSRFSKKCTFTNDIVPGFVSLTPPEFSVKNGFSEIGSNNTVTAILARRSRRCVSAPHQPPIHATAECIHMRQKITIKLFPNLMMASTRSSSSESLAQSEGFGLFDMNFRSL